LKISEGLRRYYARQRELNRKKPVMGTKIQCRENNATHPRETRATVALKEVEQAKHQLREIKERLDALKFELSGGCTW
jgi:hypothetical protein